MLIHVSAELLRWEVHGHDAPRHCILSGQLDEVVPVNDLNKMVWNDEMMLARFPCFMMRQFQYNGFGNAA